MSLKRTDFANIGETLYTGTLENGLRILLSVTLPLLCEGVLAEDPEPVRARYQSYLTILERGMLR